MDNIAQLGIKVDSTGIKQATTELSKLTSQSGKTEKGINTLSAKTSILNAKNAILALATNQVVKEIVNLSDTLTNANNKLVLVSKNVNDLTKAQDELYQVSQRTRQGYKETVDLYSNLATSMQDMGKSQSEIIRTVETVNKAIAISGSNAQQSAAAIMQLGQAFGSGQLSGDELNSLKENAQGLAKAIAQGMGVSIGQLKQLGADGKITSEVLAKALEKVADSVDKKFGNMTVSLEQGFGTVTNSLSTMTGEFLNATGASTSLANTFMDISKWLDTNKKDIVLYGQTTGAIIGKTIDNFMLLGADIKNVSELLLDSVGIMAFGALEPIAKLLLEVTKGLHDLGLSSDETLSNSQSFYDFANKGLTNFKKSAETNLQDIDNAYKKANVSVEDRIELLKKEWETSVNKKFDGKEEEKVAKKKIELTKTQIKAQEDLQKAYNEIAQIGMSAYDKSLSSIVEQTNNWLKAGVSENEVLSAKSKLIDELNSKNILENLQTELSYYEKKLQLQKDSLDKELELKGVQYANNILAIESSDKTIEQKQKLIALETELYNTTIERLKADSNTEFQDTLKSFQEDSLARQIELNNAIFDFGAGFKSSNNEIMEVSKSLAAMGDSSLKSKKAEVELNKKYTTEFNKYAGDVEKTKALEQQYTKDTDLLNKQAINNQILGYANIAGAISGMYEQGSKEAATFQAAQTVLALVEGTRAILTAGTGDPYTAIPRMAAMAIMVKSLLGNIGVSLGMSGSSTTTGDSFSMQKANSGTGSVLGDTSKASESITKSLSILEDYAKPEFRLSQQMSKSLESIDNKIGGITSLLLQNSATALGTNYTGGFNTGFKNNISTNALTSSVINPIGSILSKIPVIGQINNLFSGIINSAIGGIFGKTSVSQSLTDSGITFADAYLRDAINQLDASAYQTISTTTSKKSWFSSSSSTSLSTYFSELDANVNNQFSLVLKNLYDTVYQSGRALEIGSQSLNDSLNNFVVSIGKISLKDKTGTQIQESLSSVFGKTADDIVRSAFAIMGQVEVRKFVPQFEEYYKNIGADVNAINPNDTILVKETGIIGTTLDGFQRVGEGLFQTLTRVSTGMEQSNYFIDRLGTTFQKVNFTSIINKQGDVGFEALYQSILKVEKGANFNNILSTLSGTAEELYSAYTSLDLIRDRLTFLGKGLDGLSIASITGAGGLEQLSDGISSFIENFYSSAEQQQLKVIELNQELGRTGITTIPSTIAGFKALVNGINTTTESGQKLYGSLISLSDSFYNVYSSIEDERKTLTERLQDTKALTDNEKLTLNRQRELSSIYDATNIAILNQIYAQEDLNTANEKNIALQEEEKDKLNALIETRKSLTERLQDAQTLDDSQKLLLTRQRELSTYTDLTSISILKQIYAQEDLNTKNEKANELLQNQISNRSSLIDSLSNFVKSINDSITKDTTFREFSTSFNSMIDAIKLGSGDLSSIGDATIATAQSYLDTVARTAKSSAEIEFAKKIVANKFEGVINTKDITLGTINDTLKISFNEDSVIVKALNDVKNELVYLNQLNTRQTANSNKTLQLQRASIA